MSDPRTSNQRPLFSVIIPLEFHRNQAERCLIGWTRDQTLARSDYEIVLVAPETFPADELRKARSLLSTQDRVLTRPERHDMPLCAAGAEAARGETLFFTESHCRPEADVLEKCASRLRSHPEWAGFSCRSIRITHNRLSEIEADLYEADIEEGMLRHPWRKILDQCFVVRRDPYFQCGGFDPSLGHFAEWVLAAKFYRAGFRVGYAPEICIHHYYVGEVREWTEFTEDFIAGEFCFLSTRPLDFCADLFQEVPEWNIRKNWHRTTARRMLTMVWRDWRIMRNRAGVSDEKTFGQTVKRLVRWMSPALAGPWPARFAARIRTSALRLQIWWALHGSKERLRGAMTRYIEALVHLQRLRELCRHQGSGESFLSPPGPHLPPDQETGSSNLDGLHAPPPAGFHLAESWGGEHFRWSEPAAMVELPLAAGSHTIHIEYLPMQLPGPPARPRYYLNETPLKEAAIVEENNRATLTLHIQDTRVVRLGWVCRCRKARNDQRELGLPVCRISWRKNIPSNEPAPC